MRKERRTLPLAGLLLNAGQLDWLPKNPRQWTQSDIDRTAASIREDTDFLEDRPLLVTPDGKGKWIVFAGNLRHEGAKAAGLKQVPCVVYYPDDNADIDTIKRRAMKDNGSFGSWDFDELANSWDDLPLADWGVPVWSKEAQNEVPVDLDANSKNAPFVCKLTFPDADAMTKFVMKYKAILEKEFPGITLAESGGEL